MSIEEERFNACGRKRRYETAQKANDAIAEFERREGERGMRCYSCIWCHGFHLTSGGGGDVMVALVH